MAIETYSDLNTAIASWLNRSDLTSQIPDFIRATELDIYRRLRVRGAEKALDLALSSGTVAVPSDFAELKHAYLDGSPTIPLEVVSAALLYQLYPTRSSSGQPGYLAIDGGYFVFGPFPDAAYTLKGTYYARQSALSISNETNWLTAQAPDVLLYGALYQAAGYLMDDVRQARWLELYERALQAMKTEGRNAYYASPLIITAG